jgi:short-subunit dehydrogenase
MSRCAWSDARNLLQVNLMGGVATVAPFIPRMAQRGHGQIVGISSLSADLPIPQSAPYGASKAGFTYFLEAIDIELRGRGVAVTIVHPGFVRTPMLDDLSRVEGRLPFSVSEDGAARIIDRAIQRRARLVRFPWILSAFSWAIRRLPRWLSDPMVRRAMARTLAAEPIGRGAGQA